VPGCTTVRIFSHVSLHQFDLHYTLPELVSSLHHFLAYQISWCGYLHIRSSCTFAWTFFAVRPIHTTPRVPHHHTTFCHLDTPRFLLFDHTTNSIFYWFFRLHTVSLVHTCHAWTHLVYLLVRWLHAIYTTSFMFCCTGFHCTFWIAFLHSHGSPHRPLPRSSRFRFHALLYTTIPLTFATRSPCVVSHHATFSHLLPSYRCSFLHCHVRTTSFWTQVASRSAGWLPSHHAGPHLLHSFTWTSRCSLPRSDLFRTLHARLYANSAFAFWFHTPRHGYTTVLSLHLHLMPLVADHRHATSHMDTAFGSPFHGPAPWTDTCLHFWTLLHQLNRTHVLHVLHAVCNTTRPAHLFYLTAYHGSLRWTLSGSCTLLTHRITSGSSHFLFFLDFLSFFALGIRPQFVLHVSHSFFFCLS